MTMATMLVKLTCILHIGKSLNEVIKLFDRASWEKVVSAKEARMSMHSDKSKYFYICNNMPNCFDETMGYHSTCYNNFTAIPRIIPVLNLNEQDQEHHIGKVLRSNSQLLTATTSGVLKTCIFCKKD